MHIPHSCVENLFLIQTASLGECGLRCIMTACSGFNFNKLGTEAGECYLYHVDQSAPDVNQDTDQYFTKFMFDQNYQVSWGQLLLPEEGS